MTANLRMTPRQTYAVAHPLARADLDPAYLAPLTLDRPAGAGLILRTILAVDR